MTSTKYIGMRITNKRRSLLRIIAAQTGATWHDTSFANLKREDTGLHITAICKALYLDPGDWGGMTAAVDFALQSTMVQVTASKPVEVVEGETAMEFALRVTAGRVKANKLISAKNSPKL